METEEASDRIGESSCKQNAGGFVFTKLAPYKRTPRINMKIYYVGSVWLFLRIYWQIEIEHRRYKGDLNTNKRLGNSIEKSLT